ncbi:Diacylglycerol kinase [Campylobacter majalis]|uniref:Diacylglycerol kinase n=1 Tax=Campylobacter majalis TaxID=2790656 RepID=A0ABM8QAC5_9BACT|nr:diacylglycerol kinase [Campylobacter majalis]CAD7289812.1 Diacylglycerol kinase [Campylobacter majalis]
MRNQPQYKFFKNWGYAVNGIKDIYKNESSFRLEIFIFTPLFLSLFFLDFGMVLSLFLIFSMILVLVCECINSAIERVVDLVSPQYHALAGAAKDAGSAAVMVCNFLCAGLWIYALVGKIYE